MNRRASYKVALSGMVAALSLTAMFLTKPLAMLDYTMPAFAGILLVILVIDVSKRWALLTYAGVGFLSVLIALPQSAVLFIVFFGYYPIVKALFEQLKPRALQWLVKLVLLNAAALVIYKISTHMLFGEDLFEELESFGKYAGLMVLGLCNVLFVVYDYALTQLITLYVRTLRPKIFRG
ncbi:MAG: hypothetical protein QM689_05750 [Oscillospiraceae bacterium]